MHPLQRECYEGVVSRVGAAHVRECALAALERVPPVGSNERLDGDCITERSLQPFPFPDWHGHCLVVDRGETVLHTQEAKEVDPFSRGAPIAQRPLVPGEARALLERALSHSRELLAPASYRLNLDIQKSMG